MSKNKKLFLILFVAVFCIMLTIPIFSGVKLGEPIVRTPDPLEINLENRISKYINGEISMIDISTIATFNWDRLYFFGSYTSHEYIDSAVGESWQNNTDCNNLGELLGGADNYTLLVFVNNGVVVRCLSHLRGEHPFYFSSKGYGYGKPGFSPQEALFILSGTGRIVLKDDK